MATVKKKKAAPAKKKSAPARKSVAKKPVKKVSKSASRKRVTASSSSYSKTPLWQWILIYALVGGLIYAAVYYFVFNGNGSYGYSQTTGQYQSKPVNSSYSPY